MQGVDPDDGAALARLMSRLRFSLSTGVPAEIEVEGSPPSPALVSDRVEGEVSHVARHPEVRALMREGQRALGLPGAVVEGRDIGSVVFPDAPVKLFLTAEPDKRGERRAEQRGVADPDEVEEALHPPRHEGREGESVRARRRRDRPGHERPHGRRHAPRRDRHRARPDAGAVRDERASPEGRGDRPAERRQVDAGEPAVRPARDDLGRDAGRDARPGGGRDHVARPAVRPDRHRWLHARDPRHRIARRATRPTAPPRRPT